jgi:hypothetical protein
MMFTILVAVLTAALVATVGSAATVMDKPLPFSIFEASSGCDGAALTTGTITSVIALGDGAFCENTDQKLNNGYEQTVYTKIVFTSCDAVPMGFVFLDAYTCADRDCTDCTDVDNTPIQANLMVPKYTPLPAADTCWGVEATTTGVTVFNQFDATADAAAIDTYWKVYTENSCLKDTVEVSSASVASTALATTLGVALMAATLLN